MRGRLIKAAVAITVGVSALAIAPAAHALALPGATGGLVSATTSGGVTTYTLQGRFALGGRSVVTTASGRADVSPFVPSLSIHLVGPGLDASCTGSFQDVDLTPTVPDGRVQYAEWWYCLASVKGGPAQDLELAVTTTEDQVPVGVPVPAIHQGVFAGVDATTGPALAKTSYGTTSISSYTSRYNNGSSSLLHGRFTIGGGSFVGDAELSGLWNYGAPVDTLDLRGISASGTLVATCTWVTQLDRMAGDFNLVTGVTVKCTGSVGGRRPGTVLLKSVAPGISQHNDGHTDSYTEGHGAFVGVAVS